MVVNIRQAERRSSRPRGIGGTQLGQFAESQRKQLASPGPVSPSSASWAPRKPVQQPRSTAPSNYSPPSGGGGGSYGGGGGGGGAAPVPPAPKPPSIPSRNDWLASDSVFKAAQAAYRNAYDTLNTDINSRRDTYNTDYGNSIRDLGWNTQASPDEWNWNDTLTASGRAYQNQLNDFASRGLLQGSAYGDALENLIRSLNQQRDTMGTARDTFLSGLENERTAGKKTRDDSIRQAEVSALERYRNQYSNLT